MKKFYFIAMIGMVLALTSCRIECSADTDKSPKVTKVIDVADFKALRTYGAFDVEYAYGEKPQVKIVASQKSIEQVEVENENGTIVVKRKERSSKFDRKGSWVKIIGNEYCSGTIYITGPHLCQVSLSGSGNFVSKSQMKGDNVYFSIEGSGDITVPSVVCKNLENSIAGSGSITMKRIKAENVKNSIAGSGDLDLFMDHVGSVQNSVAGSGDISLGGTCKSVNNSVAGSGDIQDKTTKW